MARVVTLECPRFEWIPESKLPEDWEAIVNRNFSEMSAYYYESILSDESAKKTHQKADERIK